MDKKLLEKLNNLKTGRKNRKYIKHGGFSIQSNMCLYNYKIAIAMCIENFEAKMLEAYLNMHRKKYDTKGKKYNCPLCNKEYADFFSGYKAHRCFDGVYRNADGIRPYNEFSPYSKFENSNIFRFCYKIWRKFLKK